jgi:RNA polymerase sigma factor (TIGR02999 family)
VAADQPGDITLLLRRVGAGDAEAQEALFVKVCEQLRDLAKGFVRGQPANGTLGATALVNEAFLRLADGPDGGWQDRRHFFGVAAKAMRSVLVDHARRKRAVKRGGEAERVPLDGLAAPFEEQAGDIVDLDVALEELAAMDARAAKVVELRFFAGLTYGETAAVLGVSKTTVEREWEVSRAWLRERLR